MKIETYTGSGEPTNSAYFARARSMGGMFSYHHAMPGYVSVDCAMSGLEDNTHGQVGKHVLYLQHPAGTPAGIVAGAREFSEAVSTVRRQREARDFAAYNRAAEARAAEAEPPVSPEHQYASAQEAWEAEDEEAWARISGYKRS